MSTRVLLTGAGGFIGSNVARALVAHGAEVHAVELDPSRTPRLADLAGKVTMHEADLLDDDAVARVINAVKPQICVHGAWYVEPGKYLESPENMRHVGASLSLARRLIDAGCTRLVGLGTCFEYDMTGDAPLVETGATAPQSLYATCKLALHDVLASYARLTTTSFAWLRIFYQYGPAEQPGRLVPHVVDRLLGGGVADTSEGTQVRDFLHVADVGEAVALATLSSLEGIVNVGSGAPVTVREIVATIARLCDAEDRVRFGAVPQRPGDPMRVVADTSKLRAATGFTPRFTLESGLADVIAARRSELARTP